LEITRTASKVPAAQTAEINAYVGKFLIGGGTGNTDVLYTDGGFAVIGSGG